MLRNKIGPVLSATNGPFLFISYCFCKILFYLQGERDFQKKMDQILTLEKAKLDQFLTLQRIYIYISLSLAISLSVTLSLSLSLYLSISLSLSLSLSLPLSAKHYLSALPTSLRLTPSHVSFLTSTKQLVLGVMLRKIRACPLKLPVVPRDTVLDALYNSSILPITCVKRHQKAKTPQR